MKTTKRFALLIAICMMATIFSHEVYASDIGYFDYDEHDLEDITEKIQADPTLDSIDGHTIKISENRTIVIDGKDTMWDVDYNPDVLLNDYFKLPTEDGTFQGRVLRNIIYYVPSWYTGPTTYYETECVNKDGYQNVSYEVPLVSSWEEVKEYQKEHSEDLWESIYLPNVDGEEVECYAPYKTEDLFGFSLYYFGETVKEVYDLEIEKSKNYTYILPLAYDNNNRLLITLDEALFGVYDFETNEFEIITDSAIDNRLVGNELFFIDYSHNEHSCKWTETSTTTLTGNQLVHYDYNNYDLVLKDEDQQEYFKKVQEEVRSNRDAKYNYSVNYYNELYLDGEFIGNLNLPYAMEDNANLMKNDYYSSKGTWLIKDGSLNLYRYGKVLLQYKLPGNNPNWSIISLFHARATDKEYMVLFNDGVIYILADILDEDGQFLKVAENVVDYDYYCSLLEWMDSNGNGYCRRPDESENEFVCNNVVGIVHHGGGFILKPTDDRGYFSGGHRIY